MGEIERGREQFDANRPRFEENLKIEQGNITRRRGTRARRFAASVSSRSYVEHADRFFACPPSRPNDEPRSTSASCCRPSTRSGSVRTTILVLNQENMTAMDRRARTNAAISIRLMIGALIAAVALAVGAALHLSRSILRPIQAVTDGARALARGELDQIVPAASRDELGDLANAFNEMARTLREYRAGRDGAAAPRPEDRPGDDRLVSRSGGRRRPGRLGRTGQSRGSPAARRGPGRRAARSLASRPNPCKSLISDVLAGHGDYLPLSPRTGDPARRRRPGTLSSCRASWRSAPSATS